MIRVDLDELGPSVEVPLTATQEQGLAASKVVDVRAVPGGGIEVRAAGWVGATCVAGVDLRIRPKVPVRRLLFLLGYARQGNAWRDETVDVIPEEDLLPALADALARQVDAALRAGLLQGYVVVEDALPLVRGRIREADHFRRRFSFPLPIEVRFDDFTVDTAENRILRTAVERMLAVPGIRPAARAQLARQRRLLADVSPLAPGLPPPPWRATRLNMRYVPALRLAEIVLAAGSVEPLRGPVPAPGLLVSMPRLFEDVVTAALGERLRAVAGTVKAQDSSRSLDLAGQVPLRPDLVWYDGKRPRAVIDAKYKAEKPEGFPGADVYQLLAYCTAFGLTQGHLVYAAGNEQPRVYDVDGAGVQIVAHTVDLSVEPAALLRRFDQLAERVAAGVSRPDSAGPVRCLT